MDESQTGTTLRRCADAPMLQTFEVVQVSPPTSPDAGIMARVMGTADSPDHERGMPWAEWKAAALNRLFLEHGETGRPGRITAGTVRHGEMQTPVVCQMKNCRDAEEDKSR